jgi:uncharacterized protein YjiS (DUF1127 family)
MPKVLMRLKAIAKSMHSKVLSWFSIRVNLANLNALDSRTLMDIGLNRNEFMPQPIPPHLSNVA